MKTYSVETVPTVDTGAFRTTGISCTAGEHEESDGIRPLSTPSQCG